MPSRNGSAPFVVSRGGSGSPARNYGGPGGVQPLTEEGVTITGIRKRTAVIGAVLALAGCTQSQTAMSTDGAHTISPTPTPTPTSAPASTAVETPTALDVACTPRGITVSGGSVAAIGAGVVLRVSNSTAAGTYLNYTFGVHGGGGNPAPATPTRWVLLAPPGKLLLSCSRTGWEPKGLTVTVTDPHRLWRARTLAEEGCLPGGVLDTGSVGHGTTAAGAAQSLLEVEAAPTGGMLAAPGRSVRRAAIGYPDAAQQVWLLVDASGKPRESAVVYQSDNEFVALPEQICG